MSEFQSFTKQVPRARERTWRSVCNWLFKSFGLDTEQYDLSVMAVVRFRMDIIYWELMPFGGSQNWKEYVNIVIERGMPLVLFVQAFERIGSTSQVQEEGTEVTDSPAEEHTVLGEEEDDDVPREPTGEADEGEHIPELVEQVEREGQEQFDAMEDDSSDEEDVDPIPRN